MKETRLRKLLLRVGLKAHIVGWLLTAWPIFFILYQEVWKEGAASLSPLEVTAYGVPVLALPALGHLIRRLVGYQLHLGSTRSYLQSVIDNLGDLLVIVDPEGRIVFGNPLLEEYLGPVIGRPAAEVFPEESGCESLRPGAECFLTEDTIRVRRRRLLKGGQERWFEINLSPLKGELGEVRGVIQIWRDVTPQVQLEAELQEQALTDSLTKLGNSRHFFQSLAREMQRAARQGYPLALAVLDIDGFKRYNDRFGHLAGDLVLQFLGRVIREQIRREVDSGYRHGGDEFSVILPDLDEDGAARVLERISRSFAAEAPPGLSLSAGLAVSRKSESPNKLLNQADQAMYRAKEAGGGRVNVHGA